MTDVQRARIEEHLPGRDGSPGRSGPDDRLFVDAVLWMGRGAAPWGDLPPELGKGTTVHARFRRWAMAGVWERLFDILADAPDFEDGLIDSTICKGEPMVRVTVANAEASGAKGAGLRRSGARAAV